VISISTAPQPLSSAPPGRAMSFYNVTLNEWINMGHWEHAEQWTKQALMQAKSPAVLQQCNECCGEGVQVPWVPRRGSLSKFE
jgi:hypothetical protein